MFPFAAKAKEGDLLVFSGGRWVFGATCNVVASAVLAASAVVGALSVSGAGAVSVPTATQVNMAGGKFYAGDTSTTSIQSAGGAVFNPTVSADATTYFVTANGTSTASLTGVNNHSALVGYMNANGALATGTFIAGAFGVCQASPSAGSTGTYYGTYGTANRLSDGTTNTSGAVFVGVGANVSFGTTAISGTVAGSIYGMRSTPTITNSAASGSATIAAVYGMASLPTMTTSGATVTTVVTNYYGCYIGSLTSAGSGTNTITNRYGVYQVDTAAINKFLSTVASTSVATGCATFGGGIGVSGAGWFGGGAIGVPAATEVVIGAGKIYTGDTSSTSIQTAGGISAAGVILSSGASAEVKSAGTGTSYVTATGGTTSAFGVVRAVNSGGATAQFSSVGSAVAGALFTGVNRASTCEFIAVSPTAPMVIGNYATAQPIVFGINTTEVARFDTTGQALFVGGTLTTPGATGVNIAAGKIRCGDTSATSIQSTGGATITGLAATSPSVGIGYATGSGSTVTQTTSRTTGVTINTINGSITLVSAAGSATFQTFTVTNSTVAASDLPVVIQKSGTDQYEIHVTAVNAGSFNVMYRTTGGTTTEQPVFTFSVFKGVTA